jgi:hypothetical protein
MVNLNTLDEFCNPIHNLKLNGYYAFNILDINIKMTAIFIGYKYVEKKKYIILAYIRKIESLKPEHILYDPLTLTESDSAKDDPLNYFDLDSNNNLISHLRIYTTFDNGDNISIDISKLKLEKKLS